MSLHGNSSLRNVAVSAGCLAIAVFILVSNIQSRGAPADLVVASGMLKEWSVIGSGKTLRFSFVGDHRDYRVDPIYFRRAMSQRIPEEFTRGARVEVSARQADLVPASDSANVWVRSIVVDGKPVLDTRSVDSVAAANDRWGYAFILLALAALIYNLFKWRFPGARPNT